MVLLFLTSLYKTIPANIPYFTNIPYYRNNWQYTPPAQLSQPNPHLKAAYIAFAHGDKESLSDLRQTMRTIEDVFNKHHHYPYVIFTDDDLSTEYKELVASITQGDVRFEKVTQYEYGYGNTTDQFRALLARNYLKDTQGNTEEFRFKSRLMAGTIFNHAVFDELDYFWRFEPGTEYMCPIDFDPFQYMLDNHKEISYSMASYEKQETIPSLFKAVTKFKRQHAEWHPSVDVADDSLMSLMTNEDDGQYNRCYFWNSFQIATTRFFKSEAYQAFFEFIDKEDGIFYERWADPVIQSLAAALFLDRNQVHFWEDVGYRYRYLYNHCPSERAIWERCSCRPEQSFDQDGLSCLSLLQ
ncbi:glycosyltransferase family 15 protein [Mucor lusitanicus CBS 277.49]|uniref:Glycosyltransferase family 15 protein n=2 Tax=Mucor circinelloides f. lusitanicus TaxID=29924 RepID=A0A168MGN1_MUCCL|nr:glycosyltransferase family 15 protein [Mucor lusitanicus CBS 277.49]